MMIYPAIRSWYREEIPALLNVSLALLSSHRRSEGKMAETEPTVAPAADAEEEGGEDVEAEAQVDFKPLIEVSFLFCFVQSSTSFARPGNHNAQSALRSCHLKSTT
eukprot:1798011-Rhodomonas_salina.3